MLPIQEALSGILGSISLASWGSVFVPQLIENYRQQSAEALSLLFIIIWFVGDALNFIGAVWAGLVPIVIANGVCYCVTDCIMLIQCIYYKSRSRLRREIGIAKRRGSFINNNPHEDEELRPTTPLIPSRDIRSIDSEPLLPGRGREKPYKRRRACDSSVVKSVLAIIALGSAGWMVAYRLGFWQPSSTETPHKGEGRVVGAQIMGYMSALVSLGARLPQIYKNIRTKDCEGKSFHLLFARRTKLTVVSRFVTILHCSFVFGKCHNRWKRSQPLVSA